MKLILFFNLTTSTTKRISWFKQSLTNIDAEIKETEEFLSEEKINSIRTLVSGDLSSFPSATDLTVSENQVTTSKRNGEEDKWSNLRPTLRYLAFVRETSVDGEPRNGEN